MDAPLANVSISAIGPRMSKNTVRILADGDQPKRAGGSLIEYRVMKYRVYLEPDEDGVLMSTCSSLPGCVSQGRTREDATANIREVVEGYLESLRKHGVPAP